MERSVTSNMQLQVAGDARLVISVAAARCPGLTVDDRLTIVAGGVELRPEVVPAERHAVFHVVDVTVGDVEIDYAATVSGYEETIDEPVREQLSNLVPSRYAESDRLAGIAAERFDGLTGAKLVLAVRDFVHDRTAYVPGASKPTDGALDTLLEGQGVCRDFAHLVIALLRARDVPARLVSAYAPGLDPMDFHAVVEAYVDGAWQALDATGLAPRQSLLRIATGRDAADTSFLSSYGAPVTLTGISVSAVLSDADLPGDNHSGLVLLGR